MVKGLAIFTMLAVAVATTAGCGVSQSPSAPPLTGPSQLAMAVTVTANPDRISLDGASQSLITTEVRGPNGQLMPNVPLRVDMFLESSTALPDNGTLSAPTIVTGTDGRAFVTYTAPRRLADPRINQAIFTMSIRVYVVGTDAVAAIAHTVAISLVPPGVILPTANTPTASFTFTPTPVLLNVAVMFDASGSCPGQADPNTKQCLPSSSTAIASYAWTFGDGGTSPGKTATHTYTALGTFNVVLTVTNDRGVAASTTQAIMVGTTDPPKAAFTISPATDLGINQSATFNGGTSTPAAGRTLVSYTWNFGDGATDSGVLVTHAFVTAGKYSVALTVTDDVGRSNTFPQSVTVSADAGPVQAKFTFSPTGPIPGTIVNFNASSSTGSIVRYDWDFGDGAVFSSASPLTTHPFAGVGTYVVRLMVSDTGGHTNVMTQPVQVTAATPPTPPAPPGAFFTFSPTPASAGVAVNFTSTSTTPSGAAITSYVWNWGDGSGNCPANCGSGVAPFSTASHVYPLVGPSKTVTTYNVILTVKDANNLTSTATQPVAVTTP